MATGQNLISFILNGKKVELYSNPRRRLIDVLRVDFGLTGTKEGCGHGDCGSCLVLVDGKPTHSCLVQVQKIAGKSVITIEGLGTPENPHPIQKAFVEARAIQCGYCTPGLIIATKGLLDSCDKPTKNQTIEALSKNLCRCTGYTKIFEAVELAGTMLRGEPVSGMGQQDCYPGYNSLMAKATGIEKFSADLNISDIIHVKVLRSPHSHAQILNIDTSQAKKLNGVECIITAQDIPGVNLIGRIKRDQPVLAKDKVRHVGEAIVAVAAISEDVAKKALNLIDVKYKIMEAVTDPLRSTEVGSPKVHEEGNILKTRFDLKSINKGNVNQGLTEAEAIVEGLYSTPFQEHAYIELEAGVSYIDEEGKITIICSTQNPHADRSQIAPVLGLKEEQVRVVQAPTGGGFGGKLGTSVQGILGLLTQKTGKPMRLVFDRKESFISSSKRHPFRMEYKLGAMKNGKISALKANLLSDTGAYADSGQAVIVYAMIHATGPYEISNISIEGRAVYTNNPFAGAMRGFGVAQVAFAVESQIDLLASKLGMDPLEFRLLNIFRKGSTTSTGQMLANKVGLEEALKAIRPLYVEAVEKKRYEDQNRIGIKRGVGLSAIWYGTGQAGLPSPSEVALELNSNGKIHLLCSAADLGQDIKSALTLILSKELDLPFELITTSVADTSITPSAGPTVGSRQTFFSGNATIQAARSLKNALLKGAALYWNIKHTEVHFEKGYVSSSSDRLSLDKLFLILLEHKIPTRYEGRFEQSVTALDQNGQGNPFESYHFGAHMAEVDVNTNTGEVSVLRLIAAHDVGKAIDLKTVQGQIEGGSLMGLGLALFEEYVPNKHYTLSQYKIPKISDSPTTNSIIIENAEPNGPLGARGIGEPPLIAAVPAIANAISNACGSPITQLPATPQRVLRALKKK